MIDVRIAKGCYVPKRNVKYYTSMDSRKMQEEIRKLKKKDQNLVLDFTYRKKANTAVYLVSGEVVLTNLTIETLNFRMNEAEEGRVL